MYTIKINSVILKTYNLTSIELGVCTVKSRHKDKTAKYRFFVVPGDGSVLLGMPDIELLDIHKIMCEVIGDTHKKQDV